MNKIKEIEARFDAEFKDLSHIGCDNSIPCGTIKKDVKSFYHKEITALLEGIAVEVEKLRVPICRCMCEKDRPNKERNALLQEVVALIRNSNQ